MDIPGRQYNATTGYRYGFNGKEKDTESPVQYDYGFRIYDPRLVRFNSVDPIASHYPELTPYQFASNRPIQGADLDGLEFEDKATVKVEMEKLRKEKAQQVQTRVNENSSRSLLGSLWQGVKDSYHDGVSSVSSSSLKNSWKNIKGTTRDFGNMVVAKPGAAKSFSDRVTNFSISTSNSITQPVTFLGTMHTRSLNDNMYGIGYYGLQAGTAYVLDRFIGELSVGNPRIPPVANNARTFNHFTNIDGVTGITGINTRLLDNLGIGESISVNQLSFGTGTNKFMANAVGDNFVTDLGTSSTVRQLEGIGVFGDKQNFVISFSEETAFSQGVKVKGSNPQRGIFTIPANTTLKGKFTITKTR